MTIYTCDCKGTIGILKPTKVKQDGTCTACSYYPVAFTEEEYKELMSDKRRQVNENPTE